MKTIVNSSDKGVEVDPGLLRQLNRLGLIRIDGNKAKPRNKLYQEYFHRCFKEDPAKKKK